MKQLLKYACTLVATALVLASCTDEFDYTPASYEGAYIISDQSSVTFTPADATQQFTVKIVRPNGGAAETIAIESDNDAFTVPTSVTFEAGQTEAEITVTCDLVAGQQETLTLSIPDDACDLNWFSGSYSIKVKCEYLWEEAGSATLHSELLIDGFGLAPRPGVAVMHATGTNLYKLVGPYTSGYDIEFELDEDYNAANLPADQDTGLVYSGSTFHLYYYPQYGNSFTNDSNVFTMSVYIMNASSDFGVWNEKFVWDEGYPGE
ncbi:MAG: hypothetical protein J6M53_09410 [Bacteroidaceae bacterium]|nr:hypothetical protein [Bacteroidaceae bacterium]